MDPFMGNQHEGARALHDACVALARAYDTQSPDVEEIRNAELDLLLVRSKVGVVPDLQLAIDVALKHGREILRGPF
jgi:hypothetical protein